MTEYDKGVSSLEREGGGGHIEHFKLLEEEGGKSRRGPNK